MKKMESIADEHIKKALCHLFICKNPEKDFIPLNYSILKSNGELRHLGLLHPACQNQAIELYKLFSERIIKHCSQSVFSIRKPTAISSFYHIDGDKEDDDFQTSSFFSYINKNLPNGAKLSAFFESKEFMLLERKFTHFWSLDIAKFFNSIYTHSISWATKGKSFAKETRERSDFSSFFDRLMQRSNYNETNGIIIGNEVSRIFAEIIMQAVDVDVEHELKELGLVHDIDYAIRRYVDDFYIFCSDESMMQVIKSSIESKLRFYKLHTNSSKFIKRSRPFITEITKAKTKIKEDINWLHNQLFDKSGKMIRVDRTVRLFLDKIMSASYHDQNSYVVMCGYIIASIQRMLINSIKKNEFISFEYHMQKNIISILLEISFHLFSISPTASSSVKLSNICYSAYLYFYQYHNEEIDSISLEISSHIKTFFNSNFLTSKDDARVNYIPIEYSNLLSIAKSMGDKHRISAAAFNKIFSINHLNTNSDIYLENEDCLDYFHIMSALYYAGDVEEYKSINNTLQKEIGKRLSTLQNIATDSRLCYLFLDSMSCPYIDDKRKHSWLKRFEKICFCKELQEQQHEQLFAYLTQNKWFICWDTEIVIQSIKKPRLIDGYE
ncbi:RNA-directed DNA polymerase [Plesiomonas shigelloides]